MTLRPESLLGVPEATVAAVQAAFPKGNLYVTLRTEFGALYGDQLFADLYPRDAGVRRAVCAAGRGGEQPLARHATLRSAPESVPGLRAHTPPAAPHGDSHKYRPGDRLAQGRASGRTPAAARPLGPAGTSSVVTPDGALLADDCPNRVNRDKGCGLTAPTGNSATSTHEDVARDRPGPAHKAPETCAHNGGSTSPAQ
jgi:hypothetical protein